MERISNIWLAIKAGYNEAQYKAMRKKAYNYAWRSNIYASRLHLTSDKLRRRGVCLKHSRCVRFTLHEKEIK